MGSFYTSGAVTAILVYGNLVAGSCKPRFVATGFRPPNWHDVSLFDGDANNRCVLNREARGALLSTAVPFRHAPLRQPGEGHDANAAHLPSGVRLQPHFAGPDQCPRMVVRGYV
jgi:hypothetical protein